LDGDAPFGGVHVPRLVPVAVPRRRRGRRLAGVALAAEEVALLGLEALLDQQRGGPADQGAHRTRAVGHGRGIHLLEERVELVPEAGIGG
jgi:hypothetical protein